MKNAYLLSKCTNAKFNFSLPKNCQHFCAMVRYHSQVRVYSCSQKGRKLVYPRSETEEVYRKHSICIEMHLQELALNQKENTSDSQ